MLTEMNARDSRRDRAKAATNVTRGVGFGVKGIELAGAAALEKDQAGNIAAPSGGLKDFRQSDTAEDRPAQLQHVSPTEGCVHVAEFHFVALVYLISYLGVVSIFREARNTWLML